SGPPSALLLTAPPPPDVSTLSLHDALPIYSGRASPSSRRFSSSPRNSAAATRAHCASRSAASAGTWSRSGFSSSTSPAWSDSQRSEEHTSELQSRENLVCRLLLEKKNSSNV